MNRFFHSTAVLSVLFAGVLYARETDSPKTETSPENPAAVADTDNPGMGLLNQATEAKLRANSVMDLRRVIDLCQRAKRAGLASDDLDYCNKLLASSQLQCGLNLAQQLLNPQNPRLQDWRAIRQRALIDLEEAVTVIKEQPTAYLLIAQLNLMPDGNKDRAKEALQLAYQNAKNEPEIQIQATLALADLEPDAEKREAIFAAAAKDGNPQIQLSHATALFELKRNKEALDIMRKLIESESDDAKLLESIIKRLGHFEEFEAALSTLNTLREKGTSERKDRLDFMKAELFFKMVQYDDALKLLNALNERNRRDIELRIQVLLFRSDIHFALENYDEAIKDIEAVQQIMPDVPQVSELKYRVLIEQKKYNDALALTKELQEMDPDKPVHFFREVHVLSEMKKFDEAIENVQKLRKKFPDEESLWVMFLVEIHTKQKAYDKALALVEEQLKEEPEELRWIASKAEIFSEQKKWDEALNWLESCLKENPDSHEINLVIIKVLVDKKSYKAAKERMKPLLEKKPDDLSLLRADSQLSISLGLHSDAIKALTKVVEQDPEDYTSLNNLAWVLCTSPTDTIRNGRRALELAEKACKLSLYKKAFAVSTLAAAHAEVGEFDKAREWSQKSIDLAKKEEGDKTEEEHKELLESLQKEWECFKQDKPYRELMDEEGK
jgi:tetratricopeptide (TPR) repeat protein